jgi:hypothetical protein
MNAPETSARVRRRFDDLADELAVRGVKVGPMFGVPSLKAHGKAIGCLWGDAVVFKLPPEGVAAALRLKGATAFDPMGGRPMKEWIAVPSAHAARWPAFADQALDYVRGG